MKKILLSFTATLLLPVFNLAWAGLYEVSFADEKPRMTVTKAQVPEQLYLVGDKTGWEMEEGDKPVLTANHTAGLRTGAVSWTWK